LLTKEKLLSGALLEANASSLSDAVAAAKTIEELGTRLQPAFEMALSKTLRAPESAAGSARVLRIMELLESIGAQSCWPSFQAELMSHPDRVVRSKAALVIGRNTRNVAWIGRRLLDRDARVQANAVEALWSLPAADARPMLTTALQSANNRVAANAALGLYRLGDLKAVKALLNMAQHANPDFRLSAAWAIGETEDARFLPFLMDQFKSTQGKMKLSITRALSRIRRREKQMAEKGTLTIRLLDASVQQDGRRRLAFALSRSGGAGFPGMQPTDFALWEGGRLIEEYDVKLPNNPAVQVIGFIAPRILSSSEPYGDAITDSLGRCLKVKRADDLWRIDRYDVDSLTTDTGAPIERASLPYDESLITQELKLRQGFLAAADQVEKAITTPVQREKSAAGALEAIKRQGDAMEKNSGKRHMFVFLHQAAMDVLDDPQNIKTLNGLIGKESIALHGLCAGSSEGCAGFRELCLSAPEGTFLETSVDKLGDGVEQLYQHLLNRFEISYAPQAGADTDTAILQVFSDYGTSKLEVSLPARLKQPA
jgi:HEAT repeat protein